MDAGGVEPGFYVGVDVGLVEPNVRKSDGFQTFTTGVPLTVLPESVRVRGTDIGWSATVGYRINRYLAGEFAYTGFGSVDIEEVYDLTDTPSPVPTAILDSASEATGPIVSLLGIFPLSADRIEAYVRAGVFFADQRLKGDLGIASGVELNNAQELWVVGAGVSVPATRQWSARLEYQAVDELRANIMTGPIRLERLTLGVIYRF